MSKSPAVVLITGAARRIGAAIAKTLHQQNFNLVLHCHNSVKQAQELCDQFNHSRKDSAYVVSTDLNDHAQITNLAQTATERWGRLDALINNASAFYPTPIGAANEDQWHDLFSSNAKAPFFLCQALATELQRNQGSIVNLLDIHGHNPMDKHTIYCMAKAANLMMVKSLAKELAPRVQVNGVSPGAILWPENQSEQTTASQQEVLNKIPMGRIGDPQDIANTVKFLLMDAPYITGQIIAVDGGRTISS